jgi:hypothetical protein
MTDHDPGPVPHDHQPPEPDVFALDRINLGALGAAVALRKLAGRLEPLGDLKTTTDKIVGILRKEADDYEAMADEAHQKAGLS